MDPALLEELDFSSDQGEIDGMRGEVAVLNRHYEDISALGGISRSHAQMLVRDCSMQFPASAPINSFTEVPTRTNLSVAMEGLISSTARVVWELIKKAAALLLKITKWIILQLRIGLGLKREPAKGASAIKTLHAANQKFEGLAPQRDMWTNAPEVKAAQQKQAEAYASYESNFNDLIVDMLTDGRFVTAVRNVGIELLPYHDILEMKISLFQDLVSAPLPGGDAATVASIQGQLRTIAEPIEAIRMRGYLESAGVKPAGKNMFETVQRLREEQSTRRSSRATSVMDAAEATERMIGLDAEFIAPFIQNIEEWMKVMDRLQHKLSTLASSHPNGIVSQELSNAYAVAFDVVDKEVQCLRLFVVTAEACRTVRDQLIFDLFEIEKAHLVTTKAQLKNAGMNGALKDLNETVKTAFTNH